VVYSRLIDADTNMMFVLGRNILIKREEMKMGFPLGEHFVELLFNLCIRFNAYGLDDAEKALFSALVLISPGNFSNTDLLDIICVYCRLLKLCEKLIFA